MYLSILWSRNFQSFAFMSIVAGNILEHISYYPSVKVSLICLGMWVIIHMFSNVIVNIYAPISNV